MSEIKNGKDDDGLEKMRELLHDTKTESMATTLGKLSVSPMNLQQIHKHGELSYFLSEDFDRFSDIENFQMETRLNELRLQRITLSRLVKIKEICFSKIDTYHQQIIINLKTPHMLRWTVTFIILAVIAGIFGFGGIAAGAAGIAKILFFIFLVLFVISLVTGRKKI